jgi:hypothetical protein
MRAELPTIGINSSFSSGTGKFVGAGEDGDLVNLSTADLEITDESNAGVDCGAGEPGAIAEGDWFIGSGDSIEPVDEGEAVESGSGVSGDERAES